jgi:hypothetical protein
VINEPPDDQEAYEKGYEDGLKDQPGYHDAKAYVAQLKNRHDKMKAALEEILEFEGRATFSLIEGTMETNQDYMQGSHDAFQDCVTIAKQALTQPTSEGGDE